MRRQIFMLLIAATLMWLCTAGLWDIHGQDEARYVQVAKELLSRSNWFELTVNGKPYDQKPPLAFWLFGLVLKTTGGELNAWALRLPSILAAIATVLLTYFTGRHIAGAKTGFISSLFLLTSPSFIDNAPAAELNVLFTFFITLSCCAWITRPKESAVSWPRAAILWLAIAAAFFVKGPLAILVLLSVILAEWVIARRTSGIRLSHSRFHVGLPLVLLLIAGWLLIQKSIAGDQFVQNQVSGETVHRLLRGDHSKPFWYYPPRFFTSIFFPWAFLFVPATVFYWKQRKVLPSSLGAVFGWFFIPFIILSIANGKRQSYLLPMLPAASLLTGWYVERYFVTDPRAVRYLRWLCFPILSLLGIAMLVIIGLWLVNPRVFSEQDVFIKVSHVALLGLAFLITIAIGIWLYRARSVRAPVYALASAVILFGTTDAIVLHTAMNPRKSPRGFSNRLEKLLQEKYNTNVVGGVRRAAQPHYHLYGKYHVTEVDRDNYQKPETWPDVMLIRESDNRDWNEHFAEQCYAPVGSDNVMGETMLIFHRSARR